MIAPVDFTRRDPREELMDAPDIPAAELEETLEELETINRWLGGYAPSLGGLARLIPEGTKHVRVLDVGCGGGDFGRRAVEWARRRGCEARVHGIDLSETTIEFAARKSAHEPQLTFARANLFDDSNFDESLSNDKSGEWDIVHAGLFLHHIDEARAADAIAAMLERARWGVVINDLHRHRFAYHAIHILTSALSNNRLIKHDAPLSVQRAFRRADLEKIAATQPSYRHEFTWRWAFRWQWVIDKRER